MKIAPVGRWRPEHFVAGDIALELANTIAHRRDAQLAEDRFSTVDDAKAWVASVCSRDDYEIDWLERMNLIKVRAMVYAIFSSIAERQEIDGRALSQLLSVASRHFGSVRAPRPVKARRSFANEIAWAAVLTLATADHERIRSCPACGWLFIDTSKGGRRRWCAMATCGTRDKVAAYRARGAGTT